MSQWLFPMWQHIVSGSWRVSYVHCYKCLCFSKRTMGNKHLKMPPHIFSTICTKKIPWPCVFMLTPKIGSKVNRCILCRACNILIYNFRFEHIDCRYWPYFFDYRLPINAHLQMCHNRQCEVRYSARGVGFPADKVKKRFIHFCISLTGNNPN